MNLLPSNSFYLENGVYFQKGISRNKEFEKKYQELRQKERRIYPDEIVNRLPDFPKNHILKNEWRIRTYSSKKLIRYLQQQDCKKILEVGCGNGWLAHQLAINTNADVYGVDVNELELIQAARVFGSHQRISFVYGNIFSPIFPAQVFDVIILAASIQYFQNLKQLLSILTKMLEKRGAIHIIDSPIYTLSEVNKAKERSQRYFVDLEIKEMGAFYCHPTWSDLKDFSCKILYNPNTLSNRIKRKILSTSPFHWIRMANGRL
jgi:2-polyprenyl-3-methyl-5-hydroxy-6-metoxy-1,4-benzoquinol methylase